MAEAPLMPKATAVWLVDNTSLTFEQIATFCKLHPLEVKAIADGESAQGIKGMDPISSGQLTRDALEKAERSAGELTSRRAALDEARGRLAETRDEAASAHAEAERALSAAAALSLAVGAPNRAAGLYPHPGLGAWPERPLPAFTQANLIRRDTPGLG